ncbi:MAG: alpha/beta fold hydrolase [Dehalococcoidia bacterium]|nr:alpha/beta fold hydrolase [Dehalococcoidia bacterium]
MINTEQLVQTDINYNIEIKEVSFGSSDVKLTGRVLYPKTGYIVPGAVICHGFGTCYRTVEEPARMMASRGVAVLIFDFRGHGKSKGIVDENIVTDVIDAWNFLSHYPGIDGGRMALAGHSMGALAAILAAGEIRPQALIAMSCPPEIGGDLSKLSFDVPVELLDGKKQVREYPRDGSLPWTRGFAGIISRLWMRIAGDRVKVDWKKFFNIFSKARLSAVIRELKECAVLFVHCDGDSITPYTTAVALYETARGPKEILISEGGFHSTPLLAGRVRRNWTDWTVNTLRSL